MPKIEMVLNKVVSQMDTHKFLKSFTYALTDDAGGIGKLVVNQGRHGDPTIRHALTGRLVRIDRRRIGIHELLIVNSKIREQIFTAASTQEIRSQAISDGMRTLYVDGMQKAMNGITTMEEVYRVAKRGEQDVIPV